MVDVEFFQKRSVQFIIGIVMIIIMIILVFQFIGQSSSTIKASGTNISNSGLPIASLYSGTGIIILIVMAVALILIIGAIFAFKGKLT